MSVLLLVATVLLAFFAAAFSFGWLGIAVDTATALGLLALAVCAFAAAHLPFDRYFH